MTESDDLKQLWQKDNDLETLEHLFSALEPTENDKNRIKKLALQKMGMTYSLDSSDSSDSSSTSGTSGANSLKKSSLNSQDIIPSYKKKVSSMLHKVNWKYGIGVAALLLLSIIGLLDEGNIGLNTGDKGIQSKALYESQQSTDQAPREKNGVNQPPSFLQNQSKEMEIAPKFAPAPKIATDTSILPPPKSEIPPAEANTPLKNVDFAFPFIIMGIIVWIISIWRKRK